MVFVRILYYICAAVVTIEHIWTIVIAFKSAGALGVLLTFLLPVLSWAYWMIQEWGTGSGYVGFSFLACLALLVAKVLSNSHTPDR